MKRRYKLLLIILIGAILTFIINSLRITTKTNFVALGDGVSIGMTPYNVAGKSFNDYFKEKLELKNDLASYNYDFSYQYLTINDLNDILDNNNLGKRTKTPIKQIIAKANIITIAIGMDEFAYISPSDDISNEMIDKYIKDIDNLLFKIREFYKKDIILIGLYPTEKLLKKDAIEINTKLKTICGKYNANFIYILAITLNEKYYLQKDSFYLNYLAHQEISKIIYAIYKR